MKRRLFLTLVSGAAASWPLGVNAQHAATPIIGFLGPSSPKLFAERLQAFREGLTEIGYRDGHNVRIEYRWAGGEMYRLPLFAADFARQPVSIMVGAGLSAALAAKAASTSIPVVFFIGEDPVEVGLVTSLSRPSGNLTGVTTSNTEVGPKRVQLMQEVVPFAQVIGLLINPKSPNVERLITDMQAAARALNVRLIIVHASIERDFEQAFAKLSEHQVKALVITTDAFFISRIDLLAHLTLRHAIPAAFQYRDFAAAGGLLSYGGSYKDPYRQVGVYTGRILHGEKPAELPVLQEAKVELFINMNTAKMLGLTIPLSLLGRANEAIE